MTAQEMQIREYDRATDHADVVRALRSAFSHNFRPFSENVTGGWSG